MKKTSQLLLLSLLSLNGCSVAVNYYLRNSTNQPHDIILISHEDLNSRKFEFNYLNVPIENIEYNTFKRLNKIIGSSTDGKNITLSIPPRSTLYIGPGINFHQVFEKVVVKTDTLDLSDTGKFKTSHQFLAKYAVWYDIE